MLGLKAPTGLRPKTRQDGRSGSYRYPTFSMKTSR